MENRSSEPRSSRTTRRARLPWAAIAAISVTAVAAVAAGQRAPDRARTESLARRAGDRLVALQREADRLASDEATLLNDLRKLEVDRQIKAEQLAQADAAVARVQA